MLIPSPLKKWFCFALLLIAPLAWADFTYPVLVLDAADTHTLPIRFRSSTQPLPANTPVSSAGLNKLQALASGQFSVTQLSDVISQIHPPTLMIIDLRQEDHGFLNGNAISWYGINNQANINKTSQQVEQSQFQHLYALQNQAQVIVEQIVDKTPDGRIANATPLTLSPQNVFAEADLARAYNFGYTRIYVTDRQKPSDDQVEKFINTIQILPPQTWVYLHCRSGKGRATTFMSMLDMMKNAKTVSFADILARQALLSGVDLSKLPPSTDPNYSAQADRLQFLQNFYAFCSQGNIKTGWVKWTKQQELNKTIETVKQMAPSAAVGSTAPVIPPPPASLASPPATTTTTPAPVSPAVSVPKNSITSTPAVTPTLSVPAKTSAATATNKKPVAAPPSSAAQTPPIKVSVNEEDDEGGVETPQPQDGEG
ncbi:MAG: hypothetical protein HY939_05010 [Gammaproteobacteria bacterium]|nr:hypothetical protein [Gammaproteobacteria bacterium]